jgi:hypothetical protein
MTQPSLFEQPSKHARLTESQRSVIQKLNNCRIEFLLMTDRGASCYVDLNGIPCLAYCSEEEVRPLVDAGLLKVQGGKVTREYRLVQKG